MVNNAGYALDHLQFLNGKEIGGYIKEHQYVKLAVNKKIYVKFAQLTYNSVYQCRLEIKGVV